MNPVRWGILSTAKIGLQKVIPGMLKSDQLVVAAIASRNADGAREAAAKLGIATAHGSYEALLADDSIEAIYNPLPNHLHVPMTLAAAQAGKHVLCEKPMALTASELDVLRPFAGRVHLREAFMVRHHPQWIEARDIVRRGELGELRGLQVYFAYFNTDAGNIRNRADIGGGGALYDIGCYAITAGRWFFEAEPQRVMACIDRDPAFGTDRNTSGVLAFDGGRQLTFTVSTQSAPFQRIQIVGTKGRLEIEIPFNAPPDRPCRYSVFVGGESRTIELPAVDQYQLQAEAFSRAIRQDKPDARELDLAAGGLKVIDALFASEKSARWEPVTT